MDVIVFYILALFSVIAAVAVITRANPLMSAIWLVACLLAVAGIFALLASPLISVLQVLIAAGAVMVLFLFVVMLVDVGAEGLRARAISFGKVLGAIAAGYLGIVLALAIVRHPYTGAPLSGEAYESPVTLADMMLGRYAVPFELAGVLLLVSAVAAIVLAKKERSRN